MPLVRTYFLGNIAKDAEIGYSLYSNVTACLAMRIASRKSSFPLFKQTFSHDFALVFPPRLQLRSSAREQEKNKAFVREKEEDSS
jgi:hypothetical protein